jgi:hypothetical protein
MKNPVLPATVRLIRHAATMSFLIAAFHTCCCLALDAPVPKPLPCSAPAYRDFDFWLGEWDVFEEGGSVKEAQVTVSRVQNNCGLREQYDGVDGSGGESLSMYDPSAAEWQQTWLSNRGQTALDPKA